MRLRAGSGRRLSTRVSFDGTNPKFGQAAICRSLSQRLRNGVAIAAPILLAMAGAAAAQDATLPSGGVVTAGSAAIVTDGASLNVTQTSPTAIIGWNSFSIGGAATAHFDNGSGATLNRVSGNVPSMIDGSLTATGSLFLVNPAGITVGTGGMVATGGSFVGSTHDVSDADFLGQGAMAFSGSSKEGIINHGTIMSAFGDVALIARRVENDGEIAAPNGTAALLAGYDVLMQETAGENGKFAVRVGGADTEVVNSGAIRAAAAELRANGGNVLALAGNTRGVIKATGVSRSGGRIFLTAGGGKVVSRGRVSAKRHNASGGQDGGEVVVNADTVSIGGLIDASGSGGKGGKVDIGGRDIALEAAQIDASGSTGGGRIRVGGEYQGGKDIPTDEVRNAETLLIDAASTLRADGTGAGADGGMVIAWADGTTSFAGAISVSGSKGGFAEVSGKSTLNYFGWVDLHGSAGENGTLLLDPTDFTIDGVNGPALVAALNGGGDLVIATGSAGAGNGDIFVNYALEYTSADDLTLLAHRHIQANANIQNDGSGDLNLVAGWDGVTFSDFLATANSYGNGGDINIGDGTQVTGIAVGSSGGITTALARDLNLPGSNQVGAYSQLGFHGAATGYIDVTLTRDLTATANHAQTYAQVGHGGLDVAANASGDITVSAAGDIDFSGGGNSGSYAQLGHGGDNADGDHSGDITVSTPNSLTFTGSSGYAQLGHGGRIAAGSNSGAIDVSAGDASFTGGNSSVAYAQLGHGGQGTDGSLSGDISIALSGSLSLTGGAFSGDYAQIGHGGSGSGTRMGNISAIIGGMTTFDANAGGYWLGHATNTPNGISSADVALVTHGLTFAGLTAAGPAADSGDFAAMIRNDLTGGDVLIANRLPQIADADPLNPDLTDDIVHFGAGFVDEITTDQSLTLAATGEIDFDYGLQMVGTGNIGLVSGWDGSTGLDLSAFPTLDMAAIETAGAFGASSGANGDVNIGDGTQTNDVNVGTWHGDLNVLAHNVEVRGSDAQDYAYTRLGAYIAGSGDADSDITITAKGDVTVRGGSRDGGYAAIGHTINDGSGDLAGDIVIGGGDANSSVQVVSGTGQGATAQIGHDNFGGLASGDISIAGGSLLVGEDGSGAGEDAPARIGHLSALQSEGDITIATIGETFVLGGAGDRSPAGIGHTGFGDSNGNIAISARNLVAFGGFGDASEAQIGHSNGFDLIDPFGPASIAGDIDIDTTFYTALVGGFGAASFAQIGHGHPQLGMDSISGGIDITAGAGVIVLGGFSDTAFAQIGHGGDFSTAPATGDISIGTGDLFVVGGLFGDNAAARIGHGGRGALGNTSGDIDVTATGQLFMAGGFGQNSGAQIGHGANAALTSGDRKGDITVVAAGEASLQDGTMSGSEAWIGHRTGAGTISDADVSVQAFGFDRSLFGAIAPGALGSFNKDIIEADIPYGDFTLVATGTGLAVDDPVYNSPFRLLMAVNDDLVLNFNATFVNAGTGDIVLAAGGDFHNDTGSLTPIVTGGRWLVYSTRPDDNRNDMEITNWDFLRYSTPFDINDPIPGAFSSGNGLIYSVTPVVNFTVGDETIDFGQPVAFNFSRNLTVNGTAVDPLAFGLGIRPVIYTPGLAAGLPADAAGNPLTGFWAGGLTIRSVVLPWFGMQYTVDPGDLTVIGGGNNDRPVQLGQLVCRFVQIELKPDASKGGEEEQRPTTLCGIIESVTP